MKVGARLAPSALFFGQNAGHAASGCYATATPALDRTPLPPLSRRMVLPVLAPVLPGVLSLARSSGDLAWLITEAQLKPDSGSFFEGRRPSPGSPNSRDKAKISRLMDVSRSLIARTLQEERSRAAG